MRVDLVLTATPSTVYHIVPRTLDEPAIDVLCVDCFTVTDLLK